MDILKNLGTVHPFSIEDIEFLQNANRKSLEGLARGFANARLWGGYPTGPLAGNPTGYSISEGLFSINGEIYYCPAQGDTIANGLTDPVLVPYEAVDATRSPVTMPDLTTKEVHFKRTLRLEQNASQPVKFKTRDLEDYEDGFKLVENSPTLTTDVIFGEGGIGQPAAGDWADSGLGAAHNSGIATHGYETLKIRKRGRYLELQGVARCQAFVSGEVLTILGDYGVINYMPNKRRSLTVSATEGTIGSVLVMPNWMANVHFDVDGVIRVTVPGYSGSGAMMLIFNHRIALF